MHFRFSLAMPGQTVMASRQVTGQATGQASKESTCGAFASWSKALPGAACEEPVLPCEVTKLSEAQTACTFFERAKSISLSRTKSAS